MTDMEVADGDFTMGLKLILAARRNEEWRGDELTESRLQRLAVHYRTKGVALMVGENLGSAPEDWGLDAEPLTLGRFNEPRQSRTPGAQGSAREW